MTTLPADLANRALDAIGYPIGERIGDLRDGGVASLFLRHYAPAVQQLLRAAHWNFARAQVALTLLNDATGATTAAQQAAGQPVTVGTGTTGMSPWTFEYAWPVDCVKARYVPVTQLPVSGVPAGNITANVVPVVPGLSMAPLGAGVMPTPFLVTQDTVPTLIGQPATWGEYPDTATVAGQGLSYQTVILSNQPQATLVYTALREMPDQWDPLFQEAVVAFLAAFAAPVLAPNQQVGMQIRAAQIGVAKAALDQARASDGNEGWDSTRHVPDWMRARSAGSLWANRGMGGLFGGWDQCVLPDGAAY